MSDSCGGKVNFPILGTLINDGDAVWVNVESPDGNFVVVFHKDNTVTLEVFGPNHVTCRGKVIK